MANHVEANEAAQQEVPSVSETAGQILDIGQSLAGQAEAFLTSFLRPWNGYQVLIAISVWVLAHLLRAAFGPRIRAWMASREGWPTWRMRVLVVIHQRLMPIFFVLMIWIVLLVMRELTWPSRSYLIGVIATLATAWLMVVFLTRLIRSRALRMTVRYAAWVYVTLYVLGLLDEAISILDAAAISIGSFRLSLLLVVQGIVIIGALLALARFVTQSTSSRVQANEEISPSMRVLIVKVVQVVFYALAFFIGVRAIGIDLTGLAVLSGAIGVGLGFGLQKVVSNLVSGVIILLDKSIKPGDVISLGETFGWIQTLGARYASVVTRDGKEYLIPNEDLITGQVVNWSHTNDFVRLDIHFGTSYGDDPHKVRALAIEAAQSVDRVLTHRPPVCHIVGFGDSSVDYILRFWITDPTGGLTNIRGNVFLALWDTFQENGISIPFPQREVRMLGKTTPESGAEFVGD
ncbi:mechanosensitive ion channel [Aliishimia ponticola]|uniref:Mechanosensitive ion channel n=1 Tax=Aliishimia ponticola TaxID=2499833 RepID=A0A4S4NCI4_9RHOB|nr:mechanosensitive ion channel domain-containing protein [Aliishimia ponticola]THH36197.1 mechanosensitive ion channel [Aliishimia ponticola]